MATGQVRVGLFNTETRPTGLDLLPEPGPFNKQVFYAGPKPALLGPVGPTSPV